MHIVHGFISLGMFLEFLFIGLSGISAQSLQCPVDYGFQGSRNFTGAKAYADVRRFSDISAPVRKRIQEQLRSRVGNDFFKRLAFEYGSAVDTDSVEKLRANQMSRIDGYDLVFQFTDKRKGLSAFHFKVEADATGKLFDLTLHLPDIASDPRKANLISCRQALAIARKNGFPPARSSIIFVYDWDEGVFTWVVSDSKAVEPDEPVIFTGKGTYRNIAIEAHTGKVLKLYKETIIV